MLETRIQCNIDSLNTHSEGIGVRDTGAGGWPLAVVPIVYKPISWRLYQFFKDEFEKLNIDLEKPVG